MTEEEIDSVWPEVGLYRLIEGAIIRWSNDGTKTSGELTREILKIIDEEIDKED
jgi:hypothetical protein